MWCYRFKDQLDVPPHFLKDNETVMHLFRFTGLGKECESDNKCSITSNALCVTEQCFCEPGYVAKFDKSVSHSNSHFTVTQCCYVGLFAEC